jgi:hypothetical protein
LPSEGKGRTFESSRARQFLALAGASVLATCYLPYSRQTSWQR